MNFESKYFHIWLIGYYCQGLKVPSNNKGRTNQRRRQSRLDQNSNSQIARILPHFPESFNATISGTHVFRFNSDTTVSQSLSRGNLLNLVRCAVSSTAAARIFSGVRLNWIKIYSFSSETETRVQTCSVEWTSTNGPSRVISDTGNAMHPAYVHTSPPRDSLASFWSLTGNNESDVLCLIEKPVAAITDISVSFILQNGETPSSASSFSGLSTGSIGIDGPANLGPAVSYLNF